jgi:CDP-4-dehydro-6-deoxyglucose reductase
MASVPTFDARLAAARPLSPTVRELTFERVDGHPFAFEPGQWVNVGLPALGEKRAYSIASAPDGSPRFELAVTRVDGGPGSSYLHDLPVGAVLPVDGPQGFFTRPPGDEGPALFIGTGTGIAPLRSMLKAALANGSPTPVWVLFGNRHEADILYRSELDKLESLPHFRAIYTLSRAPDGWTGRRGYVQDHVPELWAELERVAGRPPHAYICGLADMVSAVRDLLRKQLGATRQQVHSERFD